MDEKEIFEQVKGLVEPFAKNKEALKSISGDSRFFQDLDVSSSRLVDIILDLETKFDVEIEDEEADTVNTIGDAVSLISSKL
jgi:acyl carrier protein